MGKNNQIGSALHWDDIRYFLALSRTGSLSATSRLLGVEHSTVARRVEHLEVGLGLKLFDRLARGWTPTQEGENLLKQAEAVEQEILGLQRQASGTDTLAGVVSISAPPIILSEWVVPGLSHFKSNFPHLNLHFVGDRRLADLTRAEVDIAIRLTQPTELELVARSLGGVTYGLYGIAKELNKTAKVYIGFDESIPNLPQKLWLDRYARHSQFSVRTNDLGCMLEAALAGYGIALLPDFLARKHPPLMALNIEGELPTLPLFLVMHPDVRLNQRVRLVADQLIEIFTG